MSEPVITGGTCIALFAFDIGFAVNLDTAERILALSPQRESLQPRRRAPSYFQYRPLPLRLSHRAESLDLGRFRSREQIEAVLYDFGALSLALSIPIDGPFADLQPLSEDLYENPALVRLATESAVKITALLGDAVDRPGLLKAVEDYFVFRIHAMEPETRFSAFLASHREDAARILRSEANRLSSQEVDDALALQVAFGEHDVCVVDWNAALVLDTDPDDALPVLEYANVQLLELRRLDNDLDDAVDRAYSLLTSRTSGWRAFLGGLHADLREIALLQADSAVAFEAANHSLKLLGDQFMARLYRAAARRFHLADWDRSVRQKLGTLDSIYAKLADERQHIRLEILEWIIIVLIALSIAVSFVPGLSH